MGGTTRRKVASAAPAITLEPLTADDEWLTAALETDPVMMRHLGGPIDPSTVPALHARRIVGIAAGDTWYFAIRLGSDGPLVGGICLWHDAHHPPGVSEAGWGVLPGYQGRGIARASLVRLLELARDDGRWGEIHAWPGVGNEPSNALCRSVGGTLIGTSEFEFRGHTLRCHDWVLPTTDVPGGA